MIMPEQFIMSNHLAKLTQTPGGLRNINDNQPDTGQKPDSQHGTRDLTPNNNTSGSKLCWTLNKRNSTQFSSQSQRVRFTKIDTQQGDMCNQLYPDSDYSDSTSGNICFTSNSDDDKTNKPVDSENEHKSRLKSPSNNLFRKPGEILSLLPLHHKLTARCQQSLQSRRSGSSGSHSLSSGYQSGSDSTERSMNVPSHIQCMIRPHFGQQKQTVSKVSCSKSGQEQSSSNDQNLQTQEKRKRFLRTREALKKSGLLEITMKTAELMKKNQMLNAELAGLKRKADEYMTSLLEHPQNKEFAEIYFLEREKRMKQDLNQQNAS